MPELAVPLGALCSVVVVGGVLGGVGRDGRGYGVLVGGIGVAAWMLLTVYTLWNVAGGLVFVAGAGVVYAVLPGVVRRYGVSDRAAVVVAVAVGAALPLTAVVADRALGGSLFVADAVVVAGSVAPGIAGHHLRRSGDVAYTVLGLVALPPVALLTLWIWLAPPCTTCARLGISIADRVPFWTLVVGSDAAGFLGLWAGLDLPIFRPFLIAAALLGSGVFGFVFVGGVGYLSYSPTKSSERATATLVVPTIAAEKVRDVLFENVAHHRARFPDCDLVYVIDEGADLAAELRERAGIDVVVVPDSYECEAIAKGRAMQYYVEHHIEEGAEEWYAFLDDDNKLVDDDFLYEIPLYEAEGYRATNPVLVPRPGDSAATYVMDWVRTLDDLLIFRFFTGLVGSPVMGFHGELLCVRGDVLAEIGFDRETIVEDFAFAMEVVKRDVPVWQSGTRVSILSPHSIHALFVQRGRWWRGILRWLPNSPWLARIVVGSRLAIWVLSVFAGWVMLFIWGFVVQGVTIPLAFFIVPIMTGVVYVVAYLYGIAHRIDESANLAYLLLIPALPVLSTLEQATAIYALTQFGTGFSVIRK